MVIVGSFVHDYPDDALAKAFAVTSPASGTTSAPATSALPLLLNHDTASDTDLSMQKHGKQDDQIPASKPSNDNDANTDSIKSIVSPTASSNTTTHKSVKWRKSSSAESQTDAKASRPIAGMSVKRANEVSDDSEDARISGATDDSTTCTWRPCDPTVFSLRIGPNYSKHGKKAPSVGSLYEMVASDIFVNTFDNSTKVYHVAKHVTLPSPDPTFEYDPRCGLPRILICNTQLINKPPRLLSSTPQIDVGCSLVLYYHLKGSTMRAALDLSTAPTGVRLFHKFANEWRTNDDIRRRFKAMGRIGNLRELGLSKMVLGTMNTYNGKPVIVFKSGKIFSGFQDDERQNSYLEIDVEVNQFAMFAQRMLCSMRSTIPKMLLRPGFVIQGESDDELPEVLLGCGELIKLDLDRAVPVCFPPHSETLKRSRTFN